MKVTSLVFIMISVVSLNALSSDHWDYCSSTHGDLLLEQGEIVSFNENVYPSPTIDKVIKTVPIKTLTETCRLEISKKRVLSISEDTILKIVRLKTETGFAEVDLICKVGGSGIPANDSCNEKTARKTMVYHVK